MSDEDPRLRQAPGNTEAEQALLGCILVNNGSLARVSKFLQGKHFHEPIHRRIYEVAFELISMGKTASPITMKTFLSKDKIGDMTVAQYMARLASEAAPIVTVRDYGEAIHDAWWARQEIMIAEDLAAAMYALPAGARPREVAVPFRDKMAQLDAEALDDARNLPGMGQRHREAMREAKTRKVIRGVPVCLPEIGRVLSEPVYSPGNLYALLSSSGEGKTSLMVQQIHFALAAGHPVILHSYDQTDEQIVRQMVAQQFEIEARRQLLGDLSEKEFKVCDDFDDWIDKQWFKVVSCGSEGASQLVTMAADFIAAYRRRRRQGPDDLDKVPFIVTDHIGSIEPVENDRRSDPGTKAKGINKVMKAGAKMLDAAWLVLNQRNTKGMERDNPMPISADLFGGDPAKQAYDAIFFLYRYKKFFEEKKAVAVGSDWKTINATFPEVVRNGSADLAVLGALKVRFGSPYVTETVDFEAQYTRLKSPKIEGNVPIEEMRSFAF